VAAPAPVCLMGTAWEGLGAGLTGADRGPKRRVEHQGRGGVTGGALKGIRRRLGDTQEAMADAMGISPSSYVVLEQGRRRMSDDLGTRALSVHREPTAWLWFEEGHAVGRDLAGGVPRGYGRRARPTVMHLAAAQVFSSG
jgi:DNA-binding XRE family transcriptional regulator